MPDNEESSDDQNSVMVPIERELSVAGPLLREEGFKERYAEERLLGQGGMGKVSLCLDRQIGRRVAMKVIRPDAASSEDRRLRFIQEARIQGQLEHPSLVPVYDLGLNPSDAVYFTMKRVKGVTLEEVIKQEREGEGVGRLPTQRKLLTAFGQVCLALDYAHLRGVLHRDLKPSNVMFGDFGEVYVLDWGLAGLEQRAERPRERPKNAQNGDGGSTPDDSVIGTVGYSSPEQLLGESERLGPASDIYSLGAILFELLCLERLVPLGKYQKMVWSTIQGVEARPSVRAPEREVAPELEAIILQATARAPEDRYQSARELQSEVEAYLDGQRAVEQRRELAQQHAERAERLVANLEKPSLEDRREAIRDLGRALTLDPENRKAFGTLRRLLTEPPSQTPREVLDELALRANARYRWMGRVASVYYLGMLLFVPFLLACGMRDWLTVAAFPVLMLICSGLSVWQSRLPRPNSRIIMGCFVLSTVALALTTRFFGPLLVTPAAIAFNTTAFALFLPARPRWIAIGLTFLCIFVLVALELLGVQGAMYRFTGEELIIRAGAIDLRELPAMALLLVVAISHVLTSAVLASRITAERRRSEERQALYAWHLRALAPEPGSELLNPNS